MRSTRQPYPPAAQNHDLLSSLLLYDTAPTPIHTLPYTTLFRSHLQPPESRAHPGGRSRSRHLAARRLPPAARRRAAGQLRSEEHTSELQSRLHLVCRLLLEKKKNG